MSKKKGKDKRIKELEDRIKKLEELRKTKPEPRKEEKPESIVGSIAGGLIPGLGGLIKMMGNVPEFADKLKEADSEISFRLQKGSLKPRVGFNYSIRPLTQGNIFKKEDELKTVVVWEETPPVEKEDLKVYTTGKKLVIETNDKKYRKEVALPCYVKDLEVEYKKGEEKGILIVRAKKR